MNLEDWAKREIEIACKKEDPENKDWDYGTACYKSAYKAFQSLMEDGHSGMSIGFTKAILNRLIDGKPLTHITDEDFFVETNDIRGFAENEEWLKDRGLKSSIQCPRMSSLFREETLDGKVTYHDNDRYYAYNYNDPHKITWRSSLVGSIIDEMYPITMPYFPSRAPMEVACDEFLTDKRNGDFDTVGIISVLKDGKDVEINKFLKEDWFDDNWVEISKEEYEERSKRRIKHE